MTRTGKPSQSAVELSQSSSSSIASLRRNTLKNGSSGWLNPRSVSNRTC